MTYTLTLCIGMFLGICGHVRTFDYPSYQDCKVQQEQFKDKVGDGYAICAPKKQE